MIARSQATDDRWLGAAHSRAKAFRDELVGEELIADYILFLLNQSPKQAYVQVLGLDEATDNIDTVLLTIAKRFGYWLKEGKPNRVRSLHIIETTATTTTY